MLSKRSLNFLFVCFFLFVGASLLWFLHIKDQDIAFYEELKESSGNLKKKDEKASTISYSQQKREGVVKDVWFAGERFRIKSEASELFFFQGQDALEVMEELTKVKCLMQEELFYCLPDNREVIQVAPGRWRLRNEANVYVDAVSSELIPMQYVRYIEAEKACYNYTTNLFLGQKVDIWKYRIEGHDLPETLEGKEPLMSGKAETAEFVLKEEKIDFVVHDFKASFIPKKGEI